MDLGASNGRVIVGQVGRGELHIDDVRRFANDPMHRPDGLHWDIDGLYREVLAGLRTAVAGGDIASAGIDSWAIDYGLLGADGRLLAPPFHYRDDRTVRTEPVVEALVDPAANYAVTGIQHLPFNTVYQLLREPTARLAAASKMLLIPDLLAFWLTGEVGAERTNASTTALYDVRTGAWSDAVIDGAGLPRRLFPALRDPGARIGSALPAAGLDGLPIVAVASHDTASAVLAVPAAGEHFAYLCTGTWSLVGVELDAPVLSDASREANFTNEVGVDGTIRYLRNVMGLWLLQECQRTWAEPDAARLLAAAESAPPFAAIVDPDDADFLAPGDMPARIDAYCARTDQAAPASRAGLCPMRRGEPGTGTPSRCPRRRSAVRTRRRCRPRGGRGSAQRSAVPVDGGRLWPAGHRRTGRGDGARQHSRAGAGERWAGRPYGDPRTGRGHATVPPVRSDR